MCYNTLSRAPPTPSPALRICRFTVEKDLTMTNTGSDPPEFRFFLAGEWRTGTPYTIACPYDGAPAGIVHRAGPAELEQAIQAAVQAYATTRKLPGHKRAAAL